MGTEIGAAKHDREDFSRAVQEQKVVELTARPLVIVVCELAPGPLDELVQEGGETIRTRRHLFILDENLLQDPCTVPTRLLGRFNLSECGSLELPESETIHHGVGALRPAWPLNLRDQEAWESNTSG